MVNDYMPIRLCLPDDARVLRIAQLCSIKDPDAAVGKVLRVWSWAQQNSVDGSIPGTESTVDLIARHSGFGAAMHKVGWLIVRPDGHISIPEWDKWNSEGAKKRLYERDKKRDQRGQFKGQNRDNSGTNWGHVRGPTETETETDVIKVRGKQFSQPNGDIPDPSDRVRILASDCERLVSKAMKRIGYEGNDGAVVWRIAALTVADEISEATFFDACEACAAKSPKNPPAYFRKCVAANVPDLPDKLRRVFVIPECPKSAPAAHRNDTIRPTIAKVSHDPTDD